MLRSVAMYALMHILLRASVVESLENSSKLSNDTECLRRFYTEPAYFDPCKSTLCFVFMQEVPFINLDKNMKTEDAVNLFPCRERNKVFPGLHGISFDILDRLPLNDALCVFTGPNCTYEGMMEFVRASRRHRLVVFGLMLKLPHRVTLHTRPSTSLLEDRVVLIGRADSHSPVHHAFSTILRPFQRATWIILGAVFLFFFAMYVLKAVYFAQPRTARNIAKRLLGEHDTVQGEMDNEDDLRLLHKAAGLSLKFAITAFFAIGLLFYEIAVVNFIFSEKRPQIRKTFANLTPQEMSEYIFVKEGGIEKVWMKLADPEKKYENRTPPWRHCEDADDCHDKILDKNHPAKFTMGYETYVRYYLKTHNACDKMAIYETSTPSYAVPAGWYYGSVPIQTQLQIDKALLHLRMEHTVSQLVNRVVDTAVPRKCAALSTDIPPDILGWLMLIIVCIFVICFFSIFICAARIRHRANEEQRIRHTESMRENDGPAIEFLEYNTRIPA